MNPVQIGDCTLHQGDCLEIMPTLGKVNAVVTDPPYGIGFEYASHNDDIEFWKDMMNAVIPLCRDAAPFVVMPSCAINRMAWWYDNHKPDWIIAWHKGSPGHASKVGFNDWEPHVSWGRPTRPMHDHFSTICGFDDNGHPCPKPIEYSMWLVKRAAEPLQTILDPFMGSGTTGVACAKLGRKFIGIELEQKYFDIACERIQKAYDQPDLFVDPPKKADQTSLLLEVRNEPAK